MVAINIEWQSRSRLSQMFQEHSAVIVHFETVDGTWFFTYWICTVFLRGWIYACAHVLVGYVESLFLYIKSRHILLTSSRLNSPSASSFSPSRCKNGWTHTHAEKRESDISKLRMFYCRRPCKWYDYKHTYTSYTKQLTNNNNKQTRQSKQQQ